jgi:hypothetical protein
MKKFLISTAISFLLAACGVKGDPKPPLTPASLGHGQPSFKRATKDIKPTLIVEPEASPVPKTQKSPSEQE